MPLGGRPLTTTLRDVCFLHWPVPRDHVATLVPDWLTPDTADGSAWVSALSMELARLDVFGLPVRERERSVAVRTYVRSPEGDRGVCFLSVDVTDRSVANTARRLFRFSSHEVAVDRSTEDGATSIRATRRDGPAAAFGLTYEPTGATQTASPDTLASFLAERYRYFTEGPLGTPLSGSVGHEPWRLQSAKATVNERSLVEGASRTELDDRPLAHYSDGVRMQFEPPTPVATTDHRV